MAGHSLGAALKAWFSQEETQFTMRGFSQMCCSRLHKHLVSPPVASQSLPHQWLKYSGQQPCESGLVQSNESQHRRGKRINVPMVMPLQCMVQKQNWSYCYCHVKCCQATFCLLYSFWKSQLAQREASFMWTRLMKRLLFMASFMNSFIMDTVFDCSLISRGLFKNSWKENKTKWNVLNHFYPFFFFIK